MKAKKAKKKKLTKTDIIEYSFFALSILLIVWICANQIPRGIHDSRVIRETLTELSFEREHYYIYVGETLTPSYSVTPVTAITDITVSASDTSIVSVSGDLTGVTGSSAGDITLTATGTPGVKANATVTVVEKQLPPDSDLPPLYKDRLKIANINNALDPDYVPEGMVVMNTVPVSVPGRMLLADTLAAYEKLYAAAVEATGQNVRIISGYRSYDYQNGLYTNRVKRLMANGMDEETAKITAGRTTQPAGHSEHQLGNSIDLSVGWDTSYDFGNTKVGKWITEHAHEYGFILRYPADKTELTGINYEPWHFRYVGLGHAEYIHSHDICVEEYVILQDEAAAAAQAYSQQITAEELAAAQAQ